MLHTLQKAKSNLAILFKAETKMRNELTDKKVVLFRAMMDKEDQYVNMKVLEE